MFPETEDQRILREAYDFQVDYTGFLWGLTAGDQGWDKTSLNLIEDGGTVVVDGERLREYITDHYSAKCPDNVMTRDLAYLQRREEKTDG